MCLIGFAWLASAEYPFALIANRDEFHQRPTQALQWWTDSPIAAGRDLQAMGTWLGVNRSGRFAAITNFRQPQTTQYNSSRGDIVRHVLESGEPIDQVSQELHELSLNTAGFNLLYGDLFGDQRQLHYLSNRDSFSGEIKPGIYAFSNGPFHAEWPKSLNIHQRFSRALHRRQPSEFWQLLQDQTQATPETLPDTGIDDDLEQFLSSIFIVGEEYGTRSSHRILVQNNQDLQISERRFNPAGTLVGKSNIIFRRPHL